MAAWWRQVVYTAYTLTLGLLTIMTAGGAMGGYLLRWRQTRQMMEGLAVLPSKPDQPQSRGALVIGQPKDVTEKNRKSSILEPIALDADDGS